MMRNTYFHMALCGVCFAAGLGLSQQLLAQPLRVVSQSDSNGCYRLTLTDADTAWRIGGTSNSLSVRVQVPAVLTILETPEWCWTTNAAGVITWRYCGAGRCVLEGAGVTFAVTSAWTGACAYDDLTGTGAYPCAIVMGELYDTQQVGCTSVDYADVVAGAANVISDVRLAFVGPVVPEPVMLVGSALALLGWRRHYWARGRFAAAQLKGKA
jgi:hypothetical protein